MLELQCYIVDISLKFQVSDHPDTISGHDSRMEEKSGKIGQNRRYIGDIYVHKRYIDDNFDGNPHVDQTHLSCCVFF